MRISEQAYRFVTVWEIPHPLDTIWQELITPERWPEWWPGVEEATILRAAQPDGTGTQIRFAWRSMFPYTLRFIGTTEEIAIGTCICGSTRGDLNGIGTWKVKELPGQCQLTYTWEVTTAKVWMNLLAPLGRPFFKLAHAHIMANGQRGLRRRLDQKITDQPSS
jgi:hypothetical protein